VYERYHKGRREAKHLMLNEFCLNTGYHRKYAIRLLDLLRESKRSDGGADADRAMARKCSPSWRRFGKPRDILDRCG
jgi:hypothetical protein